MDNKSNLVFTPLHVFSMPVLLEKQNQLYLLLFCSKIHMKFTTLTLKMYNSMVFSTFTMLCNYYHYLAPGHFQLYRK